MSTMDRILYQYAGKYGRHHFEAKDPNPDSIENRRRRNKKRLKRQLGPSIKRKRRRRDTLTKQQHILKYNYQGPEHVQQRLPLFFQFKSTLEPHKAATWASAAFFILCLLWFIPSATMVGIATSKAGISFGNIKLVFDTLPGLMVNLCLCGFSTVFWFLHTAVLGLYWFHTRRQDAKAKMEYRGELEAQTSRKELKFQEYAREEELMSHERQGFAQKLAHSTNVMPVSNMSARSLTWSSGASQAATAIDRPMRSDRFAGSRSMAQDGYPGIAMPRVAHGRCRYPDEAEYITSQSRNPRANNGRGGSSSRGPSSSKYPPGRGGPQMRMEPRSGQDRVRSRR